MENAHTALRARRLLVAVAAAVVLLAALSGRAEAQIDLSGDWNITFDGAISGSCTAAIVQTGTELFVALDCGIGSGIGHGSIDPVTRSFDLSGPLVFGVVLSGTASEDGNSISGTWDTGSLGFSGTFAGNRASETPSLIDLTGEWPILLFGDRSAPCVLSIQQSGAEVSATMECEGLESGAFDGTSNPLTGTFSINGPLGGLLIFLSGAVSEDGQSIEGTWVSRSDLLGNFVGNFGHFVSITEGAADLGAMVVDCDGAQPGVQRRCAYQPFSSFSVQLHVALPPVGGYAGFQTQLGWLEEVLRYSPAPDPLDEARWPECSSPARLVGEPDGGSSVVFGCMPLELTGGDTSTGAIVQLAFECRGVGPAGLELVPSEGDLQRGTYFVDDQGNPLDPLLITAEVSCFGLPTTGGPDTFPPAQPGGPEGTEAPQDIKAPETGSGPRPADRQVLPITLLGFSVVLFALGGAAWYTRRRT